ncbi:MAG: dockerin type I repeat-containing protein [Fimbriimonadia bacterium]|nr:dockerin type I repeat-containing protein [Fimbriimonadia bacterium]
MEHSPIQVEFRDPWLGEVIERYTLPMFAPDTEGRVSLPLYSTLPDTTCQLYIRPYRSWLGKRVSVDWERGGSLLIVLRNGDVNGDNVVDALDLAIALEQISASDSASETVWSADVNLDGVVDESDLAIIAENLGSEGDQ